MKRALEGDSPEEKKVKLPVGVAHLKEEYIIRDGHHSNATANANENENDDENGASEGRFDGLSETPNSRRNKKGKKKRGQNKNRDNRQVKESHQNQYALCPKIINGESRDNCPWGDKCRYNHDILLYLEHKASEIDVHSVYDKIFTTFDGDDDGNVKIKLGCPVWNSLGYCPMGFKCRFLSHHLNKEGGMSLVRDETFVVGSKVPIYEINKELNRISYEDKAELIKRRFPFEKSNHILEIMDAIQQENRDAMVVSVETSKQDEVKSPQVVQRELELQRRRDHQKEIYLQYKDTRYFSTEKKQLNFHRKKILSPLTTVGNLPFRRLMKRYGCDITYSEMALGVPLIQGTNSEWALPKAHISERGGYGVQIACSKMWQASKSAEALAHYCSSSDNSINEINLNSGCPIDLLYRQGSGSALLDNPARLIRCLNGMNYVSGEIPVSVKIRTGTKEGSPMAHLLAKRLVWETDVAAITLHGRSRQQRYTKLANWGYIGQVGKVLREEETRFQESEQAKDSHTRQQRIQFVGNGDVNNWEDWYHYNDTIPEMDSIMIARGALIKPWIWEEIDSQQYLDKSGSERMDMLAEFARYAMEHWGTDEYGIAQCRRYFCEFMSFFHRYVPQGICERYPVRLNERPPHWRGRDCVETQLGSLDSSDWVSLSEKFLGPVEPHFKFTPKHKSNAYTQ